LELLEEVNVPQRLKHGTVEFGGKVSLT